MKNEQRGWFVKRAEDWNQKLWLSCMKDARNQIEYDPKNPDKSQDDRLDLTQKLYDEATVDSVLSY